MRLFIICYSFIILIGCNRKLFPTAHITTNERNRDTLHYYFDYLELDESDEIRLNNGYKHALGLRAMTEMDSILKKYIKSFGFDTAVRLQVRRDRTTVDSMYNRFLRNQNDSARMLVSKLRSNLQRESNILKIRLKLTLPGSPTSGLGFYNDGMVMAGYLGILLGIKSGTFYRINTFQASPHLLMRNYLFTPQRSRKFLDRILR